MPGVLVLEGMAQTGGILAIRARPGQAKPELVYFLTIDKAKFRKPVMPGDVLEYHMDRHRAAAEHVVVSRRSQGRRRDRRRGRARRHDRRGLSVPRIDPTARVADGARIADDVEIGPYCIVGPQVELKSGVRLQSHVSIAGDTVIGERATVYPFVSLGTAPQSTGYRGEPTRLVIGNDCQFREGVTVSIGTVKGGGITTVGDRCFMMASSHVAHDCVVGNDVTFANNVALGGHVIDRRSRVPRRAVRRCTSSTGSARAP